MNNDTSIRWMIRRDMDEVLRIEDWSFEHPWSEANFVRVLRMRTVIGMIAERNDKVLGYVIYELSKTKLHMLNLAVHPKYRGQGVGRRLIENLTKRLSENRRSRLTVHVRESNLDGLLFFKACGFRAVNVLKGLYLHTDDDAILMQLHVNALECSGV